MQISHKLTLSSVLSPFLASLNAATCGTISYHMEKPLQKYTSKHLTFLSTIKPVAL